MSDIFICETEKLEKQGVKVIKIEKEYRKNGEKHTTIEVTSELDFSEHNKVFEDKIAELEKRIQELDTIDAIRIDEKKELKQRIAELESKETEKPTKYITVIVAKEINGQTYVTLDDFMSVVNDLQAEIGT